MDDLNPLGALLGIGVPLLAVLLLGLWVQGICLLDLREELAGRATLLQRQRAIQAELRAENRELQSALRAERAHVAQLTRKLALLHALLPA
ncbi:MAG TPA: hypothetical protein VJA19_00105 [Pseudomonas sp.]|nr:hypothetical protein [Pseudomonas sp.]